MAKIELKETNLPCGWLLDVDGEKLYAHSHVGAIRYSETKTLLDKLEEMSEDIENGGGGGGTLPPAEELRPIIIDVLGFTPLQELDVIQLMKAYFGIVPKYNLLPNGNVISEGFNILDVDEIEPQPTTLNESNVMVVRENDGIELYANTNNITITKQQIIDALGFTPLNKNDVLSILYEYFGMISDYDLDENNNVITNGFSIGNDI